MSRRRREGVLRSWAGDCLALPGGCRSGRLTDKAHEERRMLNTFPEGIS
jgi:hypothetical protein